MDDRWTLWNDIHAVLTPREANDLAKRETGRPIEQLGDEALHWLREMVWDPAMSPEVARG